MVSLNTRQRDILRLLLEADEKYVVSELAGQVQLTPRQVNYSLKGVKAWLSQRDIQLMITPGIGVEVHCTAEERQQLLDELGSDSAIELILSAGQRRQLITFLLLTSRSSLHISYFQNENRVSRSTILKDLEDVESWLNKFDLTIARRPNIGIWVDGSEQQIRQALVALFWGETDFEDPIWSINHTLGLDFSLKADTHLLNILQTANHFSVELDVENAMELVAFAEADMGGRFTDREVLHLSLAFAVQFSRIEHDQPLNHSPLKNESVEHFSKSLVWKVSQNLLETRFSEISAFSEPERNWEIAWIATHLLAGPKNDRWPGDSETEKSFENLTAILLKIVSDAYEMPALRFDTTLRDGFITNLIPACLRYQFDLWSPTFPEPNLLSEEKYPFEHELARKLTGEIENRTGIKLPEIEVSHVALMLRAAYIRERPQELKDVLVVCPTGMATAQLLVARLKARFSRLGNLRVVSVRELSSQRYATVDLIISTVPLSQDTLHADVLHVHPLLLPEDITAITQWLAQ